MPQSPRAERRHSARIRTSPTPYPASVIGVPAAGGNGAPSDIEGGANRPVSTASRRASVHREKTGCWTCRVRAKGCSNRVEDGRIPSRPCDDCQSLRYECLGYGSKKPRWLKEEWSEGVTGEKEVKARMRVYNARTLHEDEDFLRFQDMYAHQSWRPIFGSDDASSNEETSPPSLRTSDIDTTITPQSPLDLHAMAAPLSAMESSSSENDGPSEGFLPPWPPAALHAMVSQYLHVPGADVQSDASSPSPVIEARFLSTPAFRHHLPLYAPGFDPIGDGAYPEDNSGGPPFV